MYLSIETRRDPSLQASVRLCVAVCCLLALGWPLTAQQAVATPTAGGAPASQTTAAPTPQAPAASPQASSDATPAPENFQTGGITEDQLRQMLVGKPLYLRGGYLDNSLSFDEHGKLDGHSPQGSYTLSAIQIDHVHLTKRKVELDGARYGLRFLGQLAYEDPSKALDRVRITPKKKELRITINREQVVLPKKKKEPKPEKAEKVKAKKGKTAAAPAKPVTPTAPPPQASPIQASVAAAPEAKPPVDVASKALTVTQAHTTRVLRDALDQIFAPGLDDRMMAAMPDFWKLYYEAVAARSDYRPKDTSIFRQNTVDQKAVLMSKFEPDSNEFAQAAGVAGLSQYHAVVGPDGKVIEVAVSRPIGFGLDENAVAAIRKAQFQPAIKDGKPVAVMLNLDVPFRIFSKRTNVHSAPEAAEKPAEPQLPGPYSLPRP
jgi:TonB family protein